MKTKRYYPPKNGQAYLTKRTEVRFTEEQHSWLVNQSGSIGDVVRALVDKEMQKEQQVPNTH